MTLKLSFKYVGQKNSAAMLAGQLVIRCRTRGIYNGQVMKPITLAGTSVISALFEGFYNGGL